MAIRLLLHNTEIILLAHHIRKQDITAVHAISHGSPADSFEA